MASTPQAVSPSVPAKLKVFSTADLISPGSNGSPIPTEKELLGAMFAAASLLTSKQTPGTTDQAPIIERSREFIQGLSVVFSSTWNFARGAIKDAPLNSLEPGFLTSHRRLLFAIASDQVLGSGDRVSNLAQATEIISSDLVAAIAQSYSVRKLLACGSHERIWRPVYEEALLRGRIAMDFAGRSGKISRGGAFAAGFATRVGAALLIAFGTVDQGRQYLELIASGADVREVTRSIYRVDSLFAGALMLAGSGWGAESVGVALSTEAGKETAIWAAIARIVERSRAGAEKGIGEETWRILGFNEPAGRNQIVMHVADIVRRWKPWAWLA